MNPFLAGQLAAKGQNPVPQERPRTLEDVLRLRMGVMQAERQQAEDARSEQARMATAQAQEAAVAQAPEELRALLRTPQGFNAWMQNQFKGRAPVEWDTVGTKETGYYQVNPLTGERRQVIGAVAPKPESEPLVAVMGPDGNAVMLPRSQAAGMAPATQREDKGFSNAKDLRKEVDTKTQPYREVIEAYGKLDAALRQKSGAGDVAAVFGFMKTLDPTSVVREGEFATAENAAGIPSSIINLYNRMLSGERLAPKARQELLSTAYSQLGPYNQQYQGIRERYSGIADRFGVRREDVLPGFSFPDFEPLTIQQGPETGNPDIDNMTDEDVLGAFQ